MDTSKIEKYLFLLVCVIFLNGISGFAFSRDNPEIPFFEELKSLYWKNRKNIKDNNIKFHTMYYSYVIIDR